MARINVHGADIADGKLASLRVKMHNLPARTLDRDTTVAWLKDGHSLLTPSGLPLQLIELEEGHAVRLDNAAEDTDNLGELPSVSDAGI